MDYVFYPITYMYNWYYDEGQPKYEIVCCKRCDKVGFENTLYFCEDDKQYYCRYCIISKAVICELNEKNWKKKMQDKMKAEEKAKNELEKEVDKLQESMITGGKSEPKTIYPKPVYPRVRCGKNKRKSRKR